MSNRRKVVAVGLLFITQMVTAIVGSSGIKSFTTGDAGKDILPVAVLFMVFSGIAVVGIGILMYQMLKATNKKLAVWYPIFRAMELVISIIFGIILLVQLKEVPNHMLYLYIPTGIGGILLNYMLLKSKLVPRPVALLGLIGYASLLIGVPLDLLGILDMGKGSGQLLLLPGGLYEFVVMPILLLSKGFKTVTTAPRNRVGATV